MANASLSGPYPDGAGWLSGFGLGVVAGLIAWYGTGAVTIGVIVFAATGTALGAIIESSIDTRPLTPRERRVVWLLLGVGIVVGLIVLGSAVLAG